MVADPNAGDALTHGLDDACTLVSQDGRAPCLSGSVDGVPVGVADAARAQAHEDLLRSRRRELELRHDERTARLLQHDSPNPHAVAVSFACSRRSSSIGMWQRMRWAPSTSTSGGSCSTQIGPRNRGQRVWKTHPEGGEAALGMSPSRRIRSRPPPSIVGTAERSASVYGWCGPSNTTSAGPSSWTRPR